MLAPMISDDGPRAHHDAAHHAKRFHRPITGQFKRGRGQRMRLIHGRIQHQMVEARKLFPAGSLAGGWQLQRCQQGIQRRHPLRVAGGVGMQQVGKLGFLRVALLVGEDRVGVAADELRITGNHFVHERVELLDFGRGPLLTRGTRHHPAYDHGHFRVRGL